MHGTGAQFDVSFEADPSFPIDWAFCAFAATLPCQAGPSQCSFGADRATNFGDDPTSFAAQFTIVVYIADLAIPCIGTDSMSLLLLKKDTLKKKIISYHYGIQRHCRLRGDCVPLTDSSIKSRR